MRSSPTSEISITTARVISSYEEYLDLQKTNFYETQWTSKPNTNFYPGNPVEHNEISGHSFSIGAATMG